MDSVDTSTYAELCGVASKVSWCGGVGDLWNF